jgi:hypothetical protein
LVNPSPAANPPESAVRDRRHQREQVEMMARFRRDLVNTTVMLKDITRFGARIEGVGLLEKDEAVTLTLPGCRPSLAFVAWATDHSAGLEFAEPLDNAVFADLVTQYGMGRGPAPTPRRFA